MKNRVLIKKVARKKKKRLTPAIIKAGRKRIKAGRKINRKSKAPNVF